MVTGRPRSRTGEEVRAVALALFEERGYSNTSLSLIAERAGISRTTLFSYFPAKHDLVWGESAESIAAMREVLESRPSGESVAESIAAALHAHVAFGSAERGEVAERWRVIDSDPELRRLVTEHAEAAALMLAEYLELHVKRGVHAAHPLIAAAAIQAAGIAAARLWSRAGAQGVGATGGDAGVAGVDSLGVDSLGVDSLGVDPLGVDPLGADSRGADSRGAAPRGVDLWRAGVSDADASLAESVGAVVRPLLVALGYISVASEPTPT